MIRNNIYKFLIAFLFVFLTWLMLFNYGHCASDEYYFPMQQNENGNIPSYIIQYFNDNYSNDYFVVLRWWGHNASFNEDYIYFLIIPKTNNFRVYGEIFNNAYQFSLYNSGNESTNIENGYMGFRNGVRSDYWNGGQNISGWQSLNSSAYDSTTDFASNFMIMTNNTESAKPVLLYDDGITVPEGDTARDDMEKPDSNDYFPDWTTQPNFDNSSVENALNSVFSIIGWLGNNIKDSIVGLGDFISDTVRWSIQKVLDRISSTAQSLLSGIQNKLNDVINQIGSKIDTIYGKLEDLYEGFTDFADLFIHPFDEEEYEEQIANCELISQYDQLIDNCEDIQAIFNNAIERDSFVLYIDFENPFADAQHKIITSEISFNWLVPLRSVYRPFLWVFTLVELFTGSMRLLGNIIGGKGK